MRASKTSSLPLRLGSGLALALYVAGTAGAFTHELAVDHFICPEHGELRHGASHNKSIAKVTELGLSAKSADGEDDAGHEHCSVTSLEAPTLPLGHAELVVQVVTAELTVPVQPILAPARTYRLAPKQSPPA